MVITEPLANCGKPRSDMRKDRGGLPAAANPQGDRRQTPFRVDERGALAHDRGGHRVTVAHPRGLIRGQGLAGHRGNAFRHLEQRKATGAQIIQRRRPVHGKGPTRKPPELRQVGRAFTQAPEIPAQRADVGPPAALDACRDRRLVARQDLPPMHANTDRLQDEGRSLPRRIIGANPAGKLCRIVWRDLLEVAGESGDGVFDGRWRWRRRGSGHGAGRIIRVGFGAERDRGLVDLGLAVDVLSEARGLADEEDEQSRREGIERPGVSDAPRACGAARDGYEIVRREAGRFVDQQNTVTGSRQDGAP